MRRLEWIAGGTIVLTTIAIVLGSLSLVVLMQVRLRSEMQWIRETRTVSDALSTVETALHQAEDSARDFVLTGDRRELAAYSAALPTVTARLDALRDLLAGRPDKLDRFRKLGALVGQETDLLARVTGFAQNGTRDRAVALLTPDESRTLFANVARALHEMSAIELSELQAGRAAADNSTDWPIRSALAAAGATLAVLITGLILLRAAQRQRRLAETDLRESERLLSSIFNLAQVGIAMAGADGVLKRANATFAALLGRPGDRLRGLSVEKLAAESGAAFEAYLGRGPVPAGAGEVIAQQPDGTTRTLIALGAELDAATGAARFATFTDITAQKQTQADLEASGRRVEEQRLLLDAVLNSSIDGIMAFTAERNEAGALLQFRCVMGNHAAARLRRRPLAALIGTPLHELLVDTELYRLNDEFDRVIRTGMPFEAERDVQEPALGLRWYRLVGPDEFDMAPDYISMDSPLGRALLSRRLQSRRRRLC